MDRLRYCPDGLLLEESERLERHALLLKELGQNPKIIDGDGDFFCADFLAGGARGLPFWGPPLMQAP
jgi:hypothetical protein